MNSALFTHKWLNHVDSSAKQKIVTLSKTRIYPKGSCIHRAGDLADGLYGIRSGVVRFSKQSEEGKELLVRDLQANSWFGFIGYFGSGIRPNDATAICDSEVLHLPKAQLDLLLEEAPAIGLNVAHFLAGYVEHYNAMYEEIVFMPLHMRLIAMMEKLCRWNQSAVLEISQHELAGMLGVTKEAVGLKLSQLRDQGIVDLGYRKIIYHAYGLAKS